ncbi:hypothetical protein HIM_12463 [Hirsutella minnesotensis 3608]|uniref:Major facilitator superfamily (MFS) profile domain-containing protein n=1 Tax=Hirsutella minnesotensis 3608 TaxID=1043627 RepID=A0A0F7ZQM9_9HYPO|nr:hypothetical protein HIM_12463 [Hirsutella minnesotensis 3608]
MRASKESAKEPIVAALRVNTNQSHLAGSLNSSDNGIDPKAEQRLLLKLDLIILSIFCAMLAMSYLDRVNIGNARIQGMLEDLDLYGNRFNVALFVYFIPYILLEVPSNMLIKKTRPSLYLSSLMFLWGIINMCMGFVRSYHGLVALRILLGVTEAGFVPGAIYLCSIYYKRDEFQKRVACMPTSATSAG